MKNTSTNHIPAISSLLTFNLQNTIQIALPKVTRVYQPLQALQRNQQNPEPMLKPPCTKQLLRVRTKSNYKILSSRGYNAAGSILLLPVMVFASTMRGKPESIVLAQQKPFIKETSGPLIADCWGRLHLARLGFKPSSPWGVEQKRIGCKQDNTGLVGFVYCTVKGLPSD